MKLFLVSDSLISIRENDVKIGTKIDEANSFLRNLKKSIVRYKNFVFICNNPDDFEMNDLSAKFMAGAFKDQLAEFENVVVLDNRNKSKSEEVLTSADIVFLQGGKIVEQGQFLKEIKFAERIKHTNAVVVGKSAGAMNLGKVAYNYPEEDSEVGNVRWIEGLGLCDIIVIPHFNLINGNEYCGNFNLLEDYYIPDSRGKLFYALKNGSYIIVDNNKSIVYGESYIIKDGIVSKLCDNEDAVII